jgi:hypothetical protein
VHTLWTQWWVASKRCGLLGRMLLWTNRRFITWVGR